MVPRDGSRDDADGRGYPLLSHRDRHGAARPRSRHLAAVAAGDDRPRGVERGAGRRGQPHRNGAWPALLRPQLHLRRARRHPCGVRRRGDGCAGGDARSCAGQEASRCIRVLPRPQAGALRAPYRGYLEPLARVRILAAATTIISATAKLVPTGWCSAIATAPTAASPTAPSATTMTSVRHLRRSTCAWSKLGRMIAQSRINAMEPSTLATATK